MAKLHQSLAKWVKAGVGCALLFPLTSSAGPAVITSDSDMLCMLCLAQHIHNIFNSTTGATPSRLSTGCPHIRFSGSLPSPQRLSCGQVMALQSIDLSAQSSRNQVVRVAWNLGRVAASSPRVHKSVWLTRPPLLCLLRQVIVRKGSRGHLP